MKKLVLALMGLSVLISFAFSQMQAKVFKGSTPYQTGMSLEDASKLAIVSKEEAILAGQTLLNSNAEALSAEITVVDGFIVWAIDFGKQIAYIDVGNAEINSMQEPVTNTYASGESGESDDHGEHEDDDD